MSDYHAEHIIAKCPKCGGTDAKRYRHYMWVAASSVPRDDGFPRGQRMMTKVVCQNCDCTLILQRRELELWVAA